ncbi:MAG: hypothetical protein IJB65_02090 [Clostridia bacterium]|nr:hypothetical protein [Clostridia bacterium]
MLNNAKIKYAALFLAAVLLPPLVATYVDVSGILPAALVSSVVLGVLAASASPALAFAVPVCVYGLGYLLSRDFIASAMPLVFYPAGIFAGVCMRRKCSRRLTVALTSFGLAMGMGIEFVIITYHLCGSLSAEAFGVCYDGLYAYFADYLYDSVYNVLNANSKNYGLAEADVAAYTVAYIKTYRPMLFGTIILACNVAAYIFTAVSKRLLLYLDVNKHDGLPGTNGKWEFVLSKSSAVVFIICYICLFLGGETLTLPQTSAFYAVMLAIVGGVFLMAFRAVRNKFRMGNSNIIITGIILLLFFNSAIINILTLMLAVIGISATFKQDKKEG